MPPLMPVINSASIYLFDLNLSLIEFFVFAVCRNLSARFE